MRREPSSTMPLVAVCLLVACGGAPRPEPTSTAREAAPPPPLDTMAVSGLRGTLTQEEIQGALEPRLPKFLRCVQKRLSALEVLSGTISFAFHVATDGRVAEVQPVASTLGDRETERCMLEVAQGTRFPPPHGGEADLTWPLEVPADPDVREPVALDAGLVRESVARDGEQLLARCGGGQVVVTAYLDPEGRVIAAGAAAPDLSTSAQLDCITEGVRPLRFASPGSYVGKVSFALP